MIVWSRACNQLPCYPKSNGRVENAVKTVKNLIKKAKESGADYHLSLLSWRNTLTEGLSTSPAQQMFGCHTRTHLLTSETLLTQDTTTIRQQILRMKEKRAFYYDKNSKELPAMLKGEKVSVVPLPGDRNQK